MCPTPPDRNTVPLITLDASVLRLEGTGDDEAEHVTGAGELRPEALVTADEITDEIAERLASEIAARVTHAIRLRVDALEKRGDALDKGMAALSMIKLELSAGLGQVEEVATALVKEDQTNKSMIKRFLSRLKKAVIPGNGFDLLTAIGRLVEIEGRVESLSLALVSKSSLFLPTDGIYLFVSLTIVYSLSLSLSPSLSFFYSI